MEPLLAAETLLYAGPDALSLAENRAETLLGPLAFCPDFHRLRPEGTTHKHTIASIQTLIQEMALPPYSSPLKIFLIEEAEAMLPAAANALLKTLEEPPEDTLILLTTNSPDSLLPTIRSRCKMHGAAPKTTTIDLSSYFALAASHSLSDLFPLIKDFSIESVPSFLAALLKEGRAHTTYTQKLLEAVDIARLALERNIRPRSVLLHFLLTVFY